MTTVGEKVEFENDRVKVVRVTLTAGAKHPVHARKDRVLIWLTGGHHVRTDSKGKKEELRRQAGDVAWRTASEHQIENLAKEKSEVIIVELKQ